jgi:hypothetical protein
LCFWWKKIWLEENSVVSKSSEVLCRCVGKLQRPHADQWTSVRAVYWYGFQLCSDYTWTLFQNCVWSKYVTTAKYSYFMSWLHFQGGVLTFIDSNKCTKGFLITCNTLIKLHVSTLLGHLQGELSAVVTLWLHFIVELLIVYCVAFWRRELSVVSACKSGAGPPCKFFFRAPQ